MKSPIVSHPLLAFTFGSILTTGVIDAALIAGVDFESTPGILPNNSTNFDRTPDDLNLGDGITVSADWTVNSPGDLRHDNGAQAGPIAPSTIIARMQNTASWSITIPDTVTLNLESIDFLVRGATGSTGAPTGRDVTFNTSLDGPTLLYNNGNLIGRPDWIALSIDLSGATYQGLTDTTVSFNWNAPAGGVDIDSIVLNGSIAIPEPSSAVLMAIGAFGLLTRRRR